MTEEEVSQGVFHSDDPNTKVLCYQRSLQNLAKEKIDSDAPKYMDLNGENKIDKTADSLRRKLLFEKLPQFVDEKNRKTYEVQWLSLIHI